ncbi:MAG: beta-N-acetylhexosaminidase [Acidimicrobiia bacterium]|nr:beta-N-acetylhexosaminidase [Acidimicrobiia bacterium]
MRELIPVPRICESGTGRLAISAHTTIAVEGAEPHRLRDAAAIMRRVIVRLTGIPLALQPAADVSAADIVLSCGAPTPELPPLDMEEGYELSVTPAGATITADTLFGVARGLATFVQLVTQDAEGWYLPACRVEDAPRLAWRGLLLDVARHWIPANLIHLTLEALALAKLNVLHLHLTDDQAFRFESHRHPGLHENNADGFWFTQDELRAIVEHAAALGIRVVPELDVPGHTTSWLVAMPELGVAGVAPEPRRRFGIADCALDPASDRVLEVIDDLVGELTHVFPDPCLHIGGDEVAESAWDGDRTSLQADFNLKLGEILAAHGRRMVGWDEILHPDLPADTIVQSWRSPLSMWEAARAGHDVVLSHPWYLDHLYPARLLHAYDPLASPVEFETANSLVLDDPGTAPVAHLVRGWQGLFGNLTAAEPAGEAGTTHILGGEACMWAEHVTEENLSQRLWPRLAAFAEVLWSEPESRAGALDLSRRLDRFGSRLRIVGVDPVADRSVMLARIADDDDDLADALRILGDACEPIRFYGRLLPSALGAATFTQPPDRNPPGFQYTADTPLNRMVDCTPVESSTARSLRSDPADAVGIAHAWKAAARTITSRGAGVALVEEVIPLATDIGRLAGLLEELARGRVPAGAQSLLDAAAVPCAELRLAVVDPIRELVTEAG